MNVREIAKLAGVSPATVSLVLNDRKGVSQPVRERIKAIIQEANYVKPAWANRQTSSKWIAFIKYSLHGMVVEETAGFIAAVVEGIENEAIEQGMHLAQFACNNQNLNQVLETLTTNKADGIILLGTELSRELCRKVIALGLPLVVVDSAMQPLKVDTVNMANDRIVYQAVEHLVNYGHREVGYLQSAIEISNFKARERHFYKALSEFNLPFDNANLIRLTPTLAGSFNDMKLALSGRKSLPSAFFADNDTIALGAMKAIVEAGWKIPLDLSVIGVDDIVYAELGNPSLTTIQIPRQFIGRCSVQRLIARMEKPKSPTVHIEVGGELVKRLSTRNLSKSPRRKRKPSEGE